MAQKCFFKSLSSFISGKKSFLSTFFSSSGLRVFAAALFLKIGIFKISCAFFGNSSKYSWIQFVSLFWLKSQNLFSQIRDYFLIVLTFKNKVLCIWTKFGCTEWVYHEGKGVIVLCVEFSWTPTKDQDNTLHVHVYWNNFILPWLQNNWQTSPRT